MVPPMSNSTPSPARMTRPPGSWWGLAAFGPEATITKFTLWWPSSRIRRPIWAATSASVRPTSATLPACTSARMRSTAAPARRSASTSASSFTIRIGAVTSDARRNPSPGHADARSTTKPAQVWSPMAAVVEAPTRSATMAIGSSPSRHVTISNTSGRSTTRGASRCGTTRWTSPSRGTTSMVRRSNGMAS